MTDQSKPVRQDGDGLARARRIANDLADGNRERYNRIRDRLAIEFSDSGAPQPRGEPPQTNATQPGGSPNLAALQPTRDAAEGAVDIARCIHTIENSYEFKAHHGTLPLASCGEWKYLKRLVSATSQPAPDAMRISDAQLSEGIKWIDWNDALNIHDEMKQLRKAVERMFCLILPTDCPPNLTEEICAIVDQCRRGHVIGAECGKAIYSAVAKYAALSAPAPSPDGARAVILASMIETRPDLPLMPDDWRLIKSALRSFSATGAAEPGSDEELEARLLKQDARNMLRLIDHIADKIGLPHNEELSRDNFNAWLSSHPVRGDREAIARTISIAYWHRIERLARTSNDTPELLSILLRRPATPGADFPAWLDCADAILSFPALSSSTPVRSS